MEGKIEIRTFSKECIEKTDFKHMIQELLDQVAKQYGITCDLEEIRRINYPNPTGPRCYVLGKCKEMEAICDELGYSHCIINNGTGHDSMIMTDFADTNMIYVPSRNGGVSHCPEEWSEYEDVKKGADVLLNLIMELGKEEEK